MSLSWAEHVKQADMLLREAEQDLSTAQAQNELIRIQIQVGLATAHALLAETKRVRK